MKPFSQACENNKAPIAQVLRSWFPNPAVVLEIGSGTGQHATYFAGCLPGIHWVPSDQPESLATLLAGLQGNILPNLSAPLALEVSQQPWPIGMVDGIFTANTLHIMSIEAVEKFFLGVGTVLRQGGRLCVYGPVRYKGQFTSQSNAGFDEWLKQRNPVSGVRDIELLISLAARQGLELLHDHSMPANNQLLVWERQSAGSLEGVNARAG